VKLPNVHATEKFGRGRPNPQLLVRTSPQFGFKKPFLGYVRAMANIASSLCALYI